VNVSITAIVHNIGAADANNFTVSFFDGTSLIGNSSISVRANSTTNASIMWTAASGEHNISVVVDAGNVIVESNETNNNASKTITVEKKPDLCPTDISFSPASPTKGDSVTITAVISNSGCTAAEEFTVSFFVDGALIGNTTNISVNALSSSKAELPWRAVSGKRNIRVFVDSDDVVQESNETNNNASKAITVNTKDRRGGGGGGGGGAPRDTDGDGYSDLIEMHMGTDMRDPNDYPGAQPQTPTPTPTPTPTVKPSPTEVPTPMPGPSAKPKRGIPGFELVFAIAALFAVAYRMRKRTLN
jgi:subtilase family serine protease